MWGGLSWSYQARWVIGAEEICEPIESALGQHAGKLSVGVFGLKSVLLKPCLPLMRGRMVFQ
jgi:hypothetical protein